MAALVPLVLLGIPAAFYESSPGASCGRCHEIRRTSQLWEHSSHREVACGECHGGGIAAGLRFHLTNARRAITHFRGTVPEQIRVKSADLDAITGRCARCHRQEYAEWRAGPHGATYKDIFLDGEHNRKRLLRDDCLRCHGMHFEGGIGDLVSPVDTRGPWKFVREEVANRATLPCLACHIIHRDGPPLTRPAPKAPLVSAGEEISRPSLALFDRRQEQSVPVELLPLPEMRDGDRRVQASPDRRQALCYQCHAPVAGFQVRSGDDRTPIGVHEGISCLGCHQSHGRGTRASCANCHPRLSNCGLDVETMDTTFKSAKSAHNIHFVKCAECHVKGVPRRKVNKEAPLHMRTD